MDRWIGRQANNNHTSELKRSAFHSIHGLRAIHAFMNRSIFCPLILAAAVSAKIGGTVKTVFAGASNVKF